MKIVKLDESVNKINENFYSDYKQQMENVPITELSPGDIILATNGMSELGLLQIEKSYVDSAVYNGKEIPVYYYQGSIVYPIDNSFSIGQKFGGCKYSDNALKFNGDIQNINWDANILSDDVLMSSVYNVEGPIKYLANKYNLSFMDVLDRMLPILKDRNSVKESILTEKRKLQLKDANITRPMGWHSQLSPGGSGDSGAGACESMQSETTENEVIRLKWELQDIVKAIEKGADPERLSYRKGKIMDRLIELGVDDGWFEDSLNEAKKKQKRMINNGDPEYNRQMFNHLNGSGDMPKPPKGSDKLIGGSSADGTIGAVSGSGDAGASAGASGGM